MSDELQVLQQIAEDIGLEAPGSLLPLLQRYLDLLQRWNGTYNLTSVRERGAMLSQHVADCLAVIPALRRQVSGGSVLDVGSGGGLPGVVIAAALPAMQVTCVDTVGKKAAFVRQVAGELSLANLHAAHARVESLALAPCELITSRAFATLGTFVSLTRRHLRPNGVWMAMKGVTPHGEIAELPADIDVFHVEQLAVPGLDAQRCLVWMRVRTG